MSARAVTAMALAAGIALLEGVSALAGCTAPYAEAVDGAAVNEGDASADAPADSALPDGAILDDGSIVLLDAAASKACETKSDGTYCNGNGINLEGASKDDLVTCKGQLVSSVRLCSNGVGCVRTFSGYPDQCDECGTKADGTYCGRDMAGWDPKNAETRVRCQNHAEVGLLLCAGVCSSIGSASGCK